MENKSINFFASFNNQTGYGIHATKLAEALERKTKVYRNSADGDVTVSLVDSVSVQNVNMRGPYPSILYNVWESTEQPDWFIDRLKYFDQLWVPSEWQKACSIAQGIPEEFIKVVPEGVDPEIFKPIDVPLGETFNFLHIGQWQPRKSTNEICKAFLEAFPDDPGVRLYLAAETNFPSDNYKSTEERLRAYGFDDPRIIPVPFADHLDDNGLIKLFSMTHCFVSCSRSEGWGMPMCLSMACGIPTIVADFGGSTEYSGETGGAFRVPVMETKKPEGIYGGWDVPGEWGEPDYDALKHGMLEIHRAYADRKYLAMSGAERIREKFSWDAAADKALAIVNEIPEPNDVDRPMTAEEEIRAFARKRGYEVKLEKVNAIFVVDCWPSSQAKMDTLIETIHQIHSYGYEVLVTSHYALPAPVIQLADYYLFEKRDIMSGDDKPVYWRRRISGEVEQKPANVEYQGVAALNCFRNAIDFCKDRYEWIYQMSADMEVDLSEWLEKVRNANKPMVCIPYEGVKNGFGGGLWAGQSKLLDTVIPYLSSWKEYAEMFPDVRFVAERWIYNYVSERCDIEECVEWIDVETRNRFDNVDRTVWDDDDFQYNFMDGAYLNIVGMSNREYDVIYSTPQDGEIYRLRQKVGMWSKPNIQYFKDWHIRAEIDGEVKFETGMELEGKHVLICMGSKALGDTLAWMPYVEEFRKKHKCRVTCSSWWNTIFDYPEITFVNPGDRVEDVYASYKIGCFDNQLNLNVKNWRLTTLQQVSSDILGLEYRPIRAQLKINRNYAWRLSISDPLGQRPYVCFSEFSTMQNKLWNREGAWQEVINYLNTLGYDCVSVSMEPTNLNNVVKHNGQSIEQTISDIAGATFYIGLNHGPAWIAYSLGIPVLMMTGVSEEWNDFPNPYRISVDVGCKPCFNNPDVPIDRSWEWCPNEEKYKCTRAITPEMVIETINQMIADKDKTNASMDKEEERLGSPVHGEDEAWHKGEVNDESKCRSAKAAA